MDARRRFLRVAALFGAAATGLLLAHELDYRLVVPDPTHRHDLLLRSGHGWLQHGLMLGLVAGLLAVLATIALGAGRRRGSSPGATRVAPRLAMIQAGGFVLLEAVERVLVGAPPDDRLLAITIVGVAVQILTALIGARLLRLLERVAAVIARLFTPPPAARDPARPGTARREPVRARISPLAGAAGVRGPPVPVC